MNLFPIWLAKRTFEHSTGSELMTSSSPAISTDISFCNNILTNTAPQPVYITQINQSHQGRHIHWRLHPYPGIKRAIPKAEKSPKTPSQTRSWPPGWDICLEGYPYLGLIYSNTVEGVIPNHQWLPKPFLNGKIRTIGSAGINRKSGSGTLL